MSAFAGSPDDKVMDEPTDSELLQAFAATGGEEAFAEIVRRWGSLVYGAALRRTSDHSMAEEVTQNVFTILARRAGDLVRHPAPAAWLQKTAAYESARAVEKEANRRRIMNTYSNEAAVHAEQDDAGSWREVLPLIDDAVAALPEADRQILLLRYWQVLPFRKIAEAVGTTVAACEKRAERALGKLSRALRRRGATLTVAALAAGLTPALTKAAAAPATLTRVAAGALTAARSAPAAGSGILSAILIMKSKLTPAAVLAAVVALCGTGGWVAGRAAGPPGAAANSHAGLTGLIAANSPDARPSLSLAHQARRASLQALLKSVQRDLMTANYDPVAKARAAARVSAIAPEDIREALAVADGLIATSGDSSPLQALVLQRWAEFDGPAACEAAHARRTGKFPGMPPLADPLKVWASRDPGAAFAWYRAKASADEVKMGDTQQWKPISSLRWIMGAWALRDVGGAVQAFNSLTSKEEIQGAMIGFTEMAENVPGRVAILDAFAAKTDPKQLVSELHSLLQRWGGVQSAELAAWLDRANVPQSSHDGAAKPILTGWLRENPAAAMEWWFNAPGGYPERGHRMTTLIEAWVESDVFAAAEWMAAQPLNAAAAQSMTALASRVARSDPERGLAWALKIPEEHYRRDALKQVVSTWGSADRSAAVAAVQAAPLDAALKAELIKSAGNP